MVAFTNSICFLWKYAETTKGWFEKEMWDSTSTCFIGIFVLDVIFINVKVKI